MTECELGRTLHEVITGCDDLFDGADDQERLEWIEGEVELLARFELRAVLCRRCHAQGYAHASESLHEKGGRPCGPLVVFGGANKPGA